MRVDMHLIAAARLDLLVADRTRAAALLQHRPAVNQREWEGLAVNQREWEELHVNQQEVRIYHLTINWLIL